MRIAIVGAGITGLTLAYELGKRGHAIQIFEAGARPGGELATVEVGGEPVERFYHHLFTHDHHILQLCNELGIGDRLLWHEPAMGFFAGGRVYPFTSPQDLLRFGYLSRLARLRLGLATLYLQRKKDFHAYEDRTAAEVLPRLVGREAFEKLWLPLLRAKFHDHWNTVSMAWFWARLLSRANTRTPNKQRERLGYFMGSFRVVVDALERAVIRQGVPIHLRAPVEAIPIGEASSPALRVQGQPVQADAVVATVGLPIIRRLLPERRKALANQLAATPYVGACVALLEITQSLSPYYWTNIGDRTLPFAGLIEHTNLVGAERYGGRRLLYVSNYLPPEHEFFHMEPADVLGRFTTPIQQVFPRYRREDVVQFWLSRDPVAQPVIQAGYQRRMPTYRSPIPGFYICNTSQIYPEDRGTNYNVRIARQATEQIHADAAQLTDAAARTGV
ncbi:MAG: NAD(P)/FAD-dependent oxidoreductase [Actinobacteria bacterium]|nr:NAD(P)/FAD-dependent oxidoreductase [Actinomycetota bacterium]